MDKKINIHDADNGDLLDTIILDGDADVDYEVCDRWCEAYGWSVDEINYDVM